MELDKHFEAIVDRFAWQTLVKLYVAIIPQEVRQNGSDRVPNRVPDFALEYKVVAAMGRSSCYNCLALETEAYPIGSLYREACEER